MDKKKNTNSILWVVGFGLGIFIILSACSMDLIGQTTAPGILRLSDVKTTTTLTPFMPVPATETVIPTPAPIQLTGAGDISICGQNTDDQTAALLQKFGGYVFTLGDNQNDNARVEDFLHCFSQSWGQNFTRLLPTIGNHEYFTTGKPEGYFTYFGDRAGVPGKGYYSKNLGSWHIISLNSICDLSGTCDPDSEMIHWLENDLQQNEKKCTLAMWHIPRWSTGWHGNNGSVDILWRMMADAGVELVLNGHDHDYERFAPMNADGQIDMLNGTREFVVGTGGASLREQYTESAASQVFNNSTFGVLHLELENDAYTWQFVPVNEGGFTDAGSGQCH